MFPRKIVQVKVFHKKMIWQIFKGIGNLCVIRHDGVTMPKDDKVGMTKFLPEKLIATDLLPCTNNQEVAS